MDQGVLGIECGPSIQHRFHQVFKKEIEMTSRWNWYVISISSIDGASGLCQDGISGQHGL